MQVPIGGNKANWDAIKLRTIRETIRRSGQYIYRHRYRYEKSSRDESAGEERHIK